MEIQEDDGISLLLERCKNVRQAFQIHAQVVLKGLHQHQSVVSKLVSIFVLFNSASGLHHSRRLFALLQNPNTFLFNTLIRGHARNGFPRQAFLIFKSMNSPNKFTFSFLIASCARMENPHSGLGVHCLVLKNGFKADIFISNSLLHFYARVDDLSSACQLFDESVVKDAVSYNTIINGYAKAGLAPQALSLFKNMCGSQVQADACTFVTLLSLCSSAADLPTGRFLHQLIYKKLDSDFSNLLLKNSIVSMYAKCGEMEAAERAFSLLRESEISRPVVSIMISGYAERGETETARKMFDEMLMKDGIAWTAIIGGYSRAGRHREALKLFSEMETSGTEADEIAVSVALSACAQAGALEMTKLLHGRAEQKNWKRNPFLVTAVIDAYSKCGLVTAAEEVFREIDYEFKTVPLFNAMVTGFAQHGLGEKAMAVFREMIALNLDPDETSFISALCACSHSGMVEEGKEIFRSMPFRPSIEHYGCMVDLLCRGGLIKEALRFIEEMPMEPNSVIWHSLLAACRIHEEIRIGEVAAERLLLLGPDGGSCVLLSGVLADAQRWEDSAKARRLIQKNNNEKKPPGWSYIERNGSLNQFLANDFSHPRAREIFLKLEEMARQLKLSGHVPSTERVSFDIDEEEKQVAVMHHSEKLALAFGLITGDPGTTIRIFKNLRLCNDCHSSFKILSGVYRREIIIRDRIRFHHLKNGSCSCRDYW